MQTAPDSANSSDREIRIIRVYDAPVALVWAAWTDLEHVSKWWGPRGFTITTTSKDLRPGGSWVYTMHGPDGTDWPNFTRYHEVVPESRLVYDHGASSEDAKPMFRVTAQFRDLGGKTELDMCMTMATAEEAERSRGIIKAANGNSTWDRLGEYLEKQRTNADIFLINRTFPVDVETMFSLWTSPEHFAKWLPPTGFTMEFTRANIRTGGDAFYSMSNGAFTMYGRVQYLAVEPPNRLEYTQCFTDANENISRHPGAPVWPETMRTTVQLTPEGAGHTRVTVRWDVYGAATADEVQAFVAERGGMTRGWTGSFDKLDALIDEMSA
jgi:uncharacterized protein YndB with AHSA1/START domain